MLSLNSDLFCSVPRRNLVKERFLGKGLFCTFFNNFYQGSVNFHCQQVNYTTRTLIFSYVVIKVWLKILKSMAKSFKQHSTIRWKNVAVGKWQTTFNNTRECITKNILLHHNFCVAKNLGMYRYWKKYVLMLKRVVLPHSHVLLNA